MIKLHDQTSLFSIIIIIHAIAIITQLENGFSQSLGLIIPRSQSVSGNVVQAAKIELAERDWENAVQGLGKKMDENTKRLSSDSASSTDKFITGIASV